jgi:hypothetical protein
MKNFKKINLGSALLMISFVFGSLQAVPTQAELQAALVQRAQRMQSAAKEDRQSDIKAAGPMQIHKVGSQTLEPAAVDKAAANRARFEELFPSKPKEKLQEIGTQEIDISANKPVSGIIGAKGSKDDTLINLEATKRSNEDAFLAKQKAERTKELEQIASEKAASKILQPKTEEDRLTRMKLEESTEVRKNIGAKSSEELEARFGSKTEAEKAKSGLSSKEKAALIGAAGLGLAGGATLIAAGIANEALTGNNAPLDENAPLYEQGSDMIFEQVE